VIRLSSAQRVCHTSWTTNSSSPCCRTHRTTTSFTHRHAIGAIRTYATSSTSSSSSSSSSLNPYFVRFQLSLPEAQAAYLAWSRGQPFAPDQLKSLKAITHTDQAYLPFYAFDANVQTRFSGRVGWQTRESYYNVSTRRWETRTVTHWKHVGVDPYLYPHSYSSDLPSMQVYGAFKYRWQPVQVVKGRLSGGRMMEPRQMQPSDFVGREVDVFDMKLETAQGRVMRFIRDSEAQRGAELFKERFKADVAEVEAEVHFTAFTMRRVYQPAYIFHINHLGDDMTVIVNAVTGKVWGQYVYSGKKVGFAYFLGSSVVWLLSAVVGPLKVGLGSTFLFGVLAPSVIVGGVARYWARVREFFREQKRRSDMSADATTPTGKQYEWSAEEHARRWRQEQRQQRQQDERAYGEQQRTEQRYERTYSQHQQRFRQQFTGRTAAPRTASHYEILGVARTATLDDIRTAFRAKSFQYHPDVNRGNEKEATEKFRQVLDAYQTLRDPKKRAAYDMTLGR